MFYWIATAFIQEPYEIVISLSKVNAVSLTDQADGVFFCLIDSNILIRLDLIPPFIRPEEVMSCPTAAICFVDTHISRSTCSIAFKFYKQPLWEPSCGFFG